MKVFTTLLILVSYSSFDVVAQTIESAPADKAVIYFVRPSSLGFAINFSYFDSAQLIGKFSGPAYIRYTCNPGKHLFWARSENKDYVEANVEAGKIYFVEAIVKMGAIKAAVDLDPIDPKEEKRMKKMLKLIAKKSSQSFSSESLKAEEEAMQDVIARGLEKYADDKQNGRAFAKLKKSMFYEN
jgi:hypothetical protein